MTMVLDNQTFVLHKLRDGDTMQLRQLMTVEYRGKAIQAMSGPAAKNAIAKLRKRGQIERVNTSLPALYRITSDGVQQLLRLGLIEQINTQALKDSLKGI